MAKVDHLAHSGVVQDEVDVGGDVVLAHLMEREIPVFVVVDSQIYMLEGIDCTSAISQPYIIAFSRKVV